MIDISEKQLDVLMKFVSRNKDGQIVDVCDLGILKPEEFELFRNEDNRFFIVDPKKKNEYHNSYTVWLKDNIIEELKRRLNL